MLKYFFGILSGIFWGADTYTLSLTSLNSLILAFIHDFFSFVIVFIFILINKQYLYQLKSININKLKIVVIASFFGSFVGMGSFIMSIKYIGISASILSALYPLIGVIFSKTILKEKLSKIASIGFIISILSTMYTSIVLYNDIEFNSYGVLFGLLCAFGWGMECVIINLALKEDIQPINIVFIRQLTSSILFMLCIIFSIYFTKNNITNIQNYNYLNFIILASFFGTMSYFLYYKSIDRLGTIKAMGLNISYPFWAIVISYLFGDNITFEITIASILIIIGSIMTNI
ncbi:DMT family transporter [Campylobacter pinnipediorum]|uniref:DMT family transporter n=1 Tax=Campylobacter pinnipediorum TaxID=1965231 RepID=UPI00084D180A|nr:DMT family transporter [Campylobacter pinnipediorum]AQW81937.1 choline transporter [Campylobacter pinnipediorum subsp. pinnipediorum]AQW83608.1 choline transporter [Campylobacter pinnipediorum subsp. pinnipediorum]AQW85130.1 choline transporter [Campylobacter pinnipediorum subsp. pinnipediorum]